MPKEAAITVRVPVALKRRLATRAARERRSLSAQVVHELERSLAGEPSGTAPAHAVLGSYAGLRVPEHDEITAVRAALWERLGPRPDG